MSQKATAIGHLTKLTHRATQAGAAADNDAHREEQSSRTPACTTSSGADSVAPNPAPDVPSMFTQKIQDIIYTFSPRMSFGSSLPTPSSPQTEVDDIPSSSQDPRLPSSPNSEHSSLEHGWQSFWSPLDRFRLPYGKKPEPESVPEPLQEQVLDCVDDNNSIMMYGPLEPDETSEVEIACSEIVSINGDGEEIRTPQSSYIPLPSESFDEVVVGSPARSPLSRFVPLPFESIDQVLIGRGARSPQLRSPQLPLESIDRVLMDFGRSPPPCSSPLPSETMDRVLMGGGVRSPHPLSPPLPSGSIDQVLTRGDGELSSFQWKEGESELVSETTHGVQLPPTTEPARDQLPVKEYRIWLPSLTKISVQTMWWGFRIYLPPPVLDVLNNKQLEAVKRAAIITTALQWLMDHLPVELLPPQVRPGVTILRHLVPYVGYMGGFIAWSWSAIRSFDKGYGVVLAATWLLPFILIPGTWEAEQVTTVNPDAQTSPSASS